MTEVPESSVSPQQLSAALDHLDARAANEELLVGVREEWRAARDSADHGRFLTAQLRLAHALYGAGRLSEGEFVFFLAMPLIREFENRWLDGQYESDLADVSNRMNKIEREHGLTGDQFWPAGEGPDEHIRLDHEYSRILDAKTAEVFREFGEDSLAALWESNQKIVEELLEAGRLAVMQKQQTERALTELAMRYASEAEESAQSGLAYAACALWGAALEARLLLTALMRPDEVAGALKKADRQRRPKSRDPMRWTLAELLVIASEAGWLPPAPGKLATHLPEGWGHHLRSLRNLLHPARHLADRPRALIGDGAVSDARSAYALVVAQLERA